MKRKKKAAGNKWRMKEMQNSDRCWWWVASLFMAAMLVLIATGCSREEAMPVSTEEGLPATIRIDVNAHEPATPQTRAVDESAIHDLHVLVYNSTGELIGKNYATTTSSIVVKARSGKGCTIYVIANTNNATLWDGAVTTEAKLKALTTESLTTWNELTNSAYLVMTGSKENVDIVAGSSTIGAIAVARIAAKVTLKLTTTPDDNITIHNYRIYGLPKQAYYIARPTKTESDANDTDNVTAGDDAAKPTTAEHWTSSPVISVETANKDINFYMYENRRGVKTSITDQKDKIKANAPDSATYIVINGETNGYKYTWRVYLGANNTSNFNMKRNCTYTYNIKLKHGGATDTRVTVTDMFEKLVGGNANCYMVVPGTSVDIPVERANESPLEIEESVYNPTTKTYYQLFYNTEWYAELVWERYANSITISNGSGTGALGHFTVTAAAGIEANAVVAIKSGGNILWSWHIWVTAYKGNTTYKHNNNATNNPTFMDRALGAESVTVGDPRSGGMYYQFGRKDPFPGIIGNWSEGMPGVQGTINRILIPTDKPTNFTNSIRNPNTFYYRILHDANHSAWFDPHQSFQGENLWNGKDRAATTYPPKSVFDPCPKGWRTPPFLKGVSPFAGLNGTLTTNGMRMKNVTANTYNYWPFLGRIDANTGLQEQHNMYASYYPSTPGREGNFTTGAVTYYDFDGQIIPLNHNNCYGCAIRCVTETYQ